MKKFNCFHGTFAKDEFMNGCVYASTAREALEHFRTLTPFARRHYVVLA